MMAFLPLIITVMSAQEFAFRNFLWHTDGI